MEAELETSLGYEKNQKGDTATSNKRTYIPPKPSRASTGNSRSMSQETGTASLTPNSSPKYERDISGIEEKVISLYERGMSTRDIYDQIQELYGMELSAEMISKITDRILPEVKEWQSKGVS